MKTRMTFDEYGKRCLFSDPPESLCSRTWVRIGFGDVVDVTPIADVFTAPFLALAQWIDPRLNTLARHLPRWTNRRFFGRPDPWR